MMEEGAELESHLVESLNSVKTIKQFGIETYFNSGTDNRFSHLLKTIYASVMNGLFSSTSGELLSRLFTIILLWVGSYYVIERTITPGELLSFYALIGYFTGPVTQLIGMNKTLQNALIAADRLFEIMDLEREDYAGSTYSAAVSTTGRQDFYRSIRSELYFEEFTSGTHCHCAPADRSFFG
jgi:ATP-binding cassette subfamily B protein